MEECTFNRAKEMVKRLVAEKGFPHDESALMQKLLWAFVELGEAADAYKKGMSWEKVNEELIDVIFYILDFMGIVEDTQGVKINVDKLFIEKWKANMSRPERYGQKRGFTSPRES
ncbi:hypothetical protein CW711_02805 [Candidatus Bathyarchaeota archaeon]|nr:MAG: hypothetical protein CW680_01120 [Candidatus Bathyarchaeota archaeon]RJS79449.1 MAG: hypothetical protein CW711_02805 [Candidatus Bathyarchaeota archaeon]RLG94778.1 MAG: hypothetical protein DRO29_06270 [Candidatus Bathyarchaeota archaeon]